MSAPLSTPDVSTAIAQHLPYLRRYARALTGSQGSGDAYALATLEAILEDRSALDASLPPKCSLFRAFHLIWTSSGAPVGVPAAGLEGVRPRPARRSGPRLSAAVRQKQIPGILRAVLAQAGFWSLLPEANVLTPDSRPQIP